MPEMKPKQADALRTPKPKKKLGLVVPPSLKLPHEDLISPAVEPQEAKKVEETLTSQTSQSSPSSLTSTTRQSSHSLGDQSVAPQRDFMKVANSIGREAVPAGLFTGKSKLLYDCLYSMTRGAVVPTRTVRISRPKLMAKAHIGSRITFDTNVDRLVRVGLITVRKIAGEHEGNEYTVNLPEDIGFSQTSQTSLTSLTSSAQNLDRLVRLETSQTSHSLSTLESTTSDEPKTSFKTNDEDHDDDEAFAAFIRAWHDAAVEITGRGPLKAEAARWQELAGLLISELKIAAARTTVSSVPAFLTEHLRRRLWKTDKRELASERSADTGPMAATVFTAEQIANCPDCGGSGMYYPEGYEKGVAKCRHKQLAGQGSQAAER